MLLIFAKMICLRTSRSANYAVALHGNGVAIQMWLGQKCRGSFWAPQRCLVKLAAVPQLFLALFVLIFSSCLAMGDAVPSDVAAIESSILNARRSIRSGEFQIDVKSNVRFRGETKYHFWLGNDDQVRQERTYHDELQVSIFDRHYAYYYSARPGQMENPDLTHRKPIERMPIEKVRRDTLPHLICDPRVIMFVPGEYVLNAHGGLETIINSQGRSDFTVAAVVWNGLESKRVSFISKIGNHYEYDAIPSRGFNIVRWRLWGEAHQKDGSTSPFEYTLDADLARVGDGPIWFPLTTRLHATQNGKPTIEETVTIAITHLNEAIPDNVFTLNFSNLPPKQLVVQQPVYEPTRLNGNAHPTTKPAVGTPLYWDAGQLRPVTLRDEVERKLSGHQGDRLASSNRMKWVVFLLICIGVTALGAWVWGMTHSRGAGEQRRG